MASLALESFDLKNLLYSSAVTIVLKIQICPNMINI